MTTVTSGWISKITLTVSIQRFDYRYGRLDIEDHEIYQVATNVSTVATVD